MFINLAGLHFIRIFQGSETLCLWINHLFFRTYLSETLSLHDILLGFLFLSSMPQYTFVRILTIA